jgi:hypothetical protein
MMTGSHKAMVLHHRVDSVCLRGDHKEAAEADLQDSCGPSRALEAMPMPSVTCRYSQQVGDTYTFPHMPDTTHSSAIANTIKCRSLPSRFPTKRRWLRRLHYSQRKLRPLCTAYTRMQSR